MSTINMSSPRVLQHSLPKRILHNHSGVVSIALFLSLFHPFPLRFSFHPLSFCSLTLTFPSVLLHLLSLCFLQPAQTGCIQVLRRVNLITNKVMDEWNQSNKLSSAYLPWGISTEYNFSSLLSYISLSVALTVCMFFPHCIPNKCVRSSCRCSQKFHMDIVMDVEEGRWWIVVSPV